VAAQKILVLEGIAAAGDIISITGGATPVASATGSVNPDTTPCIPSVGASP
jgi:hypothetical protein